MKSYITRQHSGIGEPNKSIDSVMDLVPGWSNQYEVGRGLTAEFYHTVTLRGTENRTRRRRLFDEFAALADDALIAPLGQMTSLTVPPENAVRRRSPLAANNSELIPLRRTNLIRLHRRIIDGRARRARCALRTSLPRFRS